MPRLKQPMQLQNIAMDVLVNFFTIYCHHLHSHDDLESLRDVVALIKNGMSLATCQLRTEFYRKFFNAYEDLLEFSIDTPDTHRRAVLEIIMDINFTGLICEGPIVAYLDPRDGHRFLGLRVLNLSFYTHPPINLEYFQLKDLTTFVFTDNCTDANLQVIGQNCPKLVFLDVTESEAVTNRGLSHLNPCSQLRFVFVAFCQISLIGIAELLSAHERIEKLSAWSNSGEHGFDCFSIPDAIVYPRISSFTIVWDRISNEHLDHLVNKFPNLSSLGFSGVLDGDLRVLRSLGKLSSLDFSDAIDFTWDNLKELLKHVGSGITHLKASCRTAAGSCVTQSDLDHLSRCCANIELLEIDYKANFDEESLSIPPFPKLKELSCRIPRENRRRKTTLEFGRMLKLENLLIDRFYVTERNIRSMLLDSNKFPNLRVMKISEISGRYNGIDDVTQFAKLHNLDFEIIGI